MSVDEFVALERKEQVIYVMNFNVYEGTPFVTTFLSQLFS